MMVTRGRVESSESILRFRRAACCRCSFSADLSDAADRIDRAFLGRRTHGHHRPHHGRAHGKVARQTVVVENTTGAGGSIAVGRVARAVPDGYTLSIGHFGTHVISGATYQLQYDLLRDLEPVAMLATNPQILVSKTAVPARDLQELIAWVKTNQDKVSIGTGG